MRVKKNFITLFLLLVVAAVYSQTGTIRGFIYFKDNGEPAPFTNVLFKGTTIGGQTDVNGFYSISKIPPGTYTLFIKTVGYDTLTETITVKAEDIISKKHFLIKSIVKLGEIEISAEKQAKKEESRVSVLKVDAAQIKQLPTVGGQADIAQFMQVVPGAVFTGDQGGQLYIRGGTPVQNMVLMDGMVIYNPFHSIGLFSVFDADIIRNADVYTGGFNTQYGGRISSVLDITTRDGNKKRIAGKFSASPFGAKLLAEGPILRATDDQDKSTISYIFSAKTSYLPQTSKVLYKYANKDGLPFRYDDYYGKISVNSPNGSKLNVFGFNFNDNVTNYQALADFGWTSTGVGSNFVLVPSSSQILVQGNVAYSSYDMHMKDQVFEDRFSAIDGFNMGVDFTYYIGKSNIQYGLDILGFSTEFTFFNQLKRKITQKDNTTELAGYVKYKAIFANNRVIIEPGLRGHYYASLSNFSPEPRINMKWNVVDKFRLKAAGGWYSQNLLSATSDRDVVNLFYGFLSGPENLQTSFTNQDGSVSEVNHRLQKATHIIAGLEWDPFNRFEVNLEAYYKNFTQLSNLNRTKVYEDNGDNSAQPDYLKKDFIIETGKAYGVDLLVKYDNAPKGIYVWVVYSLGFVTRWDGIQEYRPPFDRRHTANIVIAYSFGKHKSWEVDARWNFGSGFPFTPIQGYYENVQFNNINTDYTKTNGLFATQLGAINSRQLPYYHRLDLSVKKKFTVTERIEIEAAAGVSNAYNRPNIFYVNEITQQRVDQLPILPTLSIGMTF